VRFCLVIAAVIGVGILALIGVRVADSMDQIGTIVSSLPLRSESTRDEPARPDASTSSRLEPVISDFAPAPADVGITLADEAAAATLGDGQILRWLAADPEFQRAADELKRDPDPEVRREAAQFLSELGVD